MGAEDLRQDCNNNMTLYRRPSIPSCRFAPSCKSSKILAVGQESNFLNYVPRVKLSTGRFR
eukprot:6482395-Amphidinium_carterae.1